MSTVDMFAELVDQLVKDNAGAPPTVQQLVEATGLSVEDAKEILGDLKSEGLLPPAKKQKTKKAAVEKEPVAPNAGGDEAPGSSVDKPLEPARDSEDSEEDKAPLVKLVPRCLRPYTASTAAVNPDQLETLQETLVDDLEQELDKSVEEAAAPPASTPVPSTPLQSAFAKGRLGQ